MTEPRFSLASQTRHRHHRRVALSYVALAASIVTACAQGRPPEPSPTSSFGETYLQLREAAVVYGASELQLATLDEFSDGREIPLAVVTEAMDRTFACFEDNGLPYSSKVYEKYPGFPIYEISWGTPPGLTEEESRVLGNTCSDSESAFIAALYEQQSSFVDQRDSLFEQVRPELLGCLRDHGVQVDDDATRDEVYQFALELLRSGVVSEPTCFPPE